MAHSTTLLWVRGGEGGPRQSHPPPTHEAHPGGPGKEGCARGFMGERARKGQSAHLESTLCVSGTNRLTFCFFSTQIGIISVSQLKILESGGEVSCIVTQKANEELRFKPRIT